MSFEIPTFWRFVGIFAGKSAKQNQFKMQSVKAEINVVRTGTHKFS